MDNHLYCNDTHGKSYKVLVSTKTHQTEQHPCWQSFICWFQCRKRRHFIDCVTCFLLWIFHCMHVLCNQSCYALLSCVFERKGVCSMRLSSKRRESLTHLYIHKERILSHPLLFHVILFLSTPLPNVYFVNARKFSPNFHFPSLWTAKRQLHRMLEQMKEPTKHLILE